MERTIEDKVRRVDITQYLSRIGKEASEAGREVSRTFRYHVDLWHQVQALWAKEDITRNIRFSFAAFYAVMNALSYKPQKITEIASNCDGWAYPTVAKVLRTVRDLPHIKTSRSLTDNCRFLVYWIDKEKESQITS